MNNHAFRACRLLAAVPAALLIALGCGGSGNGKSNAFKVPEGIWAVTVTTSGPVAAGTGTALIHPDGTALVQVGSQYVLAGVVNINGFSGLAVSANGAPVADGQAAAPASFASMPVVPPATFQGVGQVGSSPAQISFGAADPAYGQAFDPITLAGLYTSAPAANNLNETLTLTLGADGSLSGTSSDGASLAGTCALVVGKAMAEVELRITPPGGGAPVDYAGLAQVTVNAGASSLRMILASSDRGLTASFGH